MHAVDAGTEHLSDIGSLQIRVLRILWQLGTGTVHEVLDAFPGGEKPAYTTVLQVLRSLERRGLVAHIKQCRQHRFRPTVQAGDLEAGVVHSLLDRIFGGSPQRLVARLLEAASLDPGELQGIRQLIEQHETMTPVSVGGKR